MRHPLDGAVAQLGERVVRNDEVGGSIPPGSTSLRRLRLLRLGKPYRSEGCRVVARRAKTGLGKPYRSEGCRVVARRAKTGGPALGRAKAGEPRIDSQVARRRLGTAEIRCIRGGGTMVKVTLLVG